MRIHISQQRLLLYCAAIVFAVAATTYSLLWIVHMRQWIPTPGISNYEYSAAKRVIAIGEVVPGSPADEAGLRAGDYITAINGRTLDSLIPLYETMIVARKGVVDVAIERPGASGVRHARFVFGGQLPQPRRTARLQDLLYLPVSYYPLGFLIVGLAVLFLRIDDHDAWLLALLFGSWLAGGPLREGVLEPHMRGFAMFYKVTALGLTGGLFYYFFAVFPAQSPIDRKFPWLKHLAVWGNIGLILPVAVRCFIAGGSSPLYAGTNWPGTRALAWLTAGQAGLPAPAIHIWPGAALMFGVNFVGLTVLGFISLASNVVFSADNEVRRKARVIVWGAVVGVGPSMLGFVVLLTGAGAKIPLVAWEAMVVLLSLVWPLSFAYAVVKHRVLEIPMLLKRSARYLLVQRGFISLLFLGAALAITLFTHVFARFFPGYSDVGMALSAVFGIVLVWVSAPLIRRVTEQIDRAFFRSAYDAQQVLEDLVRKTGRTTGREKLAELLDSEISYALHPTSLAIYLESGEGPGDGPLVLWGTDKAGSTFEAALPPDAPVLRDLARRGEPREMDPKLVGKEATVFGSVQPECLVPILNGDSQLTGVIVLGTRLSEEPYSREDKRLLASVASQAAVALENIRLGEGIAKRIEADRRMALEMEIARQVQARLFPQRAPQLTTLEYTGTCIQARQVGGDYYDFLELRPGRVALVVADVAGKGVSGALMMANLQANLRSQYAMALDNVGELLSSVNRLFYANSGASSYATLFFADYDDSTRRLRYVNCGHLAPLLLRVREAAGKQAQAEESVERLESTCTVLGLFEHWECKLEEVQLFPGDVLVLYTDGVTEAEGPGGEEFGEFRLLQTLAACSRLPVPLLQQTIIEAVQKFAFGEQHDDITLVVARCTDAAQSGNSRAPLRVTVSGQPNWQMGGPDLIGSAYFWASSVIPKSRLQGLLQSVMPLLDVSVLICLAGLNLLSLQSIVPQQTRISVGGFPGITHSWFWKVTSTSTHLVNRITSNQ